MGGGFGWIFMTLLVVVVIVLLGAFRQIRDDRHNSVADKPRARAFWTSATPVARSMMANIRARRQTSNAEWHSLVHPHA